MQDKRKAIIAAVLPLVAAVAMYLATGDVDVEEISLAVSGLVAALLVYFVPNAPRSPKRRR